MIKLIVVIAGALALFAIAEARNQSPNQNGPQIFGQRTHSSFLLAEKSIRVYNANPNGRVRRLYNFPHSAADEARSPRVGAVYIWNSRITTNTRVTMIMGGIGKRYIGLELWSGHGEHLDARIEVYSL